MTRGVNGIEQNNDSHETYPPKSVTAYLEARTDKITRRSNLSQPENTFQCQSRNVKREYERVSGQCFADWKPDYRRQLPCSWIIKPPRISRNCSEPRDAHNTESIFCTAEPCRLYWNLARSTWCEWFVVFRIRWTERGRIPCDCSVLVGLLQSRQWVGGIRGVRITGKTMCGGGWEKGGINQRYQTCSRLGCWAGGRKIGQKY